MNVEGNNRNRNAWLIIAPLLIALVAIGVIFDPLHLFGETPEAGQRAVSHAPLWLWVIGAGILGSALAYGILQAGDRTRAQKEVSERATDDLYRREEQDRRQQQLP